MLSSDSSASSNANGDAHEKETFRCIAIAKTTRKQCKRNAWEGQYCFAHHPSVPVCNWKNCARTDVKKGGLCDYHTKQLQAPAL